ncbi:MAG: hypothetical protein ACR2HC_05140 [Thermoleophilaceae bacterium]
MSDTAILVLCLVFVAIGVYNASRAWKWTEIPEVLEGREYMIPAQIPGAIFFGGGPLFFLLEALLRHPADGSPRAIALASIVGAVMLIGLVLAATTSYLGWPRRIIAPIARDRPRRTRDRPERPEGELEP